MSVESTPEGLSGADIIETRGLTKSFGDHLAVDSIDLGVRERIERAVADFGAGLSPAERATFAQGLASAQGSFRVSPTNPATAANPGPERRTLP